MAQERESIRLDPPTKREGIKMVVILADAHTHLFALSALGCCVPQTPNLPPVLQDLFFPAHSNVRDPSPFALLDSKRFKRRATDLGLTEQQTRLGLKVLDTSDLLVGITAPAGAGKTRFMTALLAELHTAAAAAELHAAADTSGDGYRGKTLLVTPRGLHLRDLHRTLLEVFSDREVMMAGFPKSLPEEIGEPLQEIFWRGRLTAS